jgi:hypothetical protein
MPGFAFVTMSPRNALNGCTRIHDLNLLEKLLHL